MRILLVGAGYVGLVTAACFAEMGHVVTCLDIDAEKIQRLQRGEIPIFEPGLEEMVRRHQKQKRLLFTTNYPDAVRSNKVCFIAVPTPSLPDGACNTSYVEAAYRQIASHMEGEKIFVNKSTVPVGTADQMRSVVQTVLQERSVDYPFDIVSNPEFLKEGAAIQDCLKPDRIVLGAEKESSFALLKEIYAPFVVNHDRILCMDTKSAEMTKYAANAMLACRISFMNEIARICSHVGANVHFVRKGIGSDPRIGYSFLYPGIGYGGSCFPKDVQALIQVAKRAGVEPLLLEAVEGVNLRQKKLLSQKMAKYFSPLGGIAGKTIAIWGLAFKPDTDDMREAPSLELIRDLLEGGATLRLFDPIAMENAKKLFPTTAKILWCDDEGHAAEGADAIALLTEWKQFRLVELEPLKTKMRGSAFFDGRNQYNPYTMRSKGFHYMGIGVPEG